MHRFRTARLYARADAESMIQWEAAPDRAGLANYFVSHVGLLGCPGSTHIPATFGPEKPLVASQQRKQSKMILRVPNVLHDVECKRVYLELSVWG